MTITALPAAPSRSDPTNFSNEGDALLGALAQFVTEANALAVTLNLASTTSTSVTSDTIATGATTITVNTAKSYQPGMSVKIARTSSPSNWMHGDVTSYNAGTGALVVNVLDILGSGTFTDWTITLSAPNYNIPFATAAQIIAGTPNLAIPPDQLAILGPALGAANLIQVMNAAGTAKQWGGVVKNVASAWDLATATGTQVLTGAGFRPSSHVVMWRSGANTVGIGIALDYCLSARTDNALSGAVNTGTIYAGISPGNYAVGTMTYTSDGGSISWVKTGSPTGILYFNVLWFR